MSRILPDPQIQSYRAMRAGAIAFGIPAVPVHVIGVSKIAFAQPLVQLPKSLTAVPSTEALSGAPGESPVVGAPFVTNLSVDVLQSKSLSSTNALETLVGTFNEAPAIGVGFSTSVV